MATANVFDTFRFMNPYNISVSWLWWKQAKLERRSHSIPRILDCWERGRAWFRPPQPISTMAARRHRMVTQELSQPPSLVRSPEFNTCNFYIEAINPLFGTKRVLLRRLFFIAVDRTKYVSVGFYPNRDYLPLVEFWAVKKNGSTFIILNDQHFNKVAECLPRICDSMCGNERDVCKGCAFRLNTIGTNGVAR